MLTSILLNSSKQKTFDLSTIAIFFLALLYRGVYLIMDPLLMRDSTLYIILAEKWFENNSYNNVLDSNVVVPPLPIYFIKEMMCRGYNAETAGRSISMFLGACIPVLGFVITRKLFRNILISYISAILFIIHPELVSFSIQPLRENYFFFYLSFLLLSAINGVQNNKICYWILAGFFLSLMFFCRYEALEFLVIIPAILIFSYRKKKKSLKRIFFVVSIFFLSFFATTVLLLNITNFNLAFLYKVKSYSNQIDYFTHDQHDTTDPQGD